MLSVPGGAVIIDRVLGLGFVAVLAGRGLRPALSRSRGGGHQEKAACDEQDSNRYNK
jgi:hypothetical protein